MSNQLIKEAQKSGMFISKEKLIEILNQSSTKEFTISQRRTSFSTLLAKDDEISTETAVRVAMESPLEAGW